MRLGIGPRSAGTLPPELAWTRRFLCLELGRPQVEAANFAQAPVAVNSSAAAPPNRRAKTNSVHDFLNVIALLTAEDLQRQRTHLLRLPVLLLQILLGPAQQSQNPDRWTWPMPRRPQMPNIESYSGGTVIIIVVIITDVNDVRDPVGAAGFAEAQLELEVVVLKLEVHPHEDVNCEIDVNPL